MTDPAVVVGGGIAGIACARELNSAGIQVRLLDRGRALGGRMASRTMRDTGTGLDGRVVDIGASYFTVQDPDFAALVESLIDQGVVRRWTDAFHVHDEGTLIGVKAGPMRYAAPRGLRSVVEHLAAELTDTQMHHAAVVESIAAEAGRVRIEMQDDAPRFADRVGACMPPPQATRLLDASVRAPLEDELHALTWEPVIAVTMAFAERAWDVDGVFVNDDPVLTWIADDGSRRGDGAPVLVAHVHPVLASRHLADPAEVMPAAVAATRRVIGIEAMPDWVDVQRWTFARPIGAHAAPFARHPELALGLAGDAWHGGPRIEAAWASGRALGAWLASR